MTQPEPKTWQASLRPNTRAIYVESMTNPLLQVGDLKEVTRKLNLLGGALDPHACFLLHRGVKTLAVRMKQHNENTLRIARLLEGHAKVARVNYPGLESQPHHARASE